MKATSKQIDYLRVLAQKAGLTEAEVCSQAGVSEYRTLRMASASRLINSLREETRGRKTDKGFVYIAFDGGAEPNPGPAAAAAAVFINGEPIDEKVKLFGRRTSNEAEWEAVLLALDLYNEHGLEATIEGDSKLVVNQLIGKFEVKAKNLKELANEGKDRWLALNSPKVKWVRRELNEYTDALVNKALKREGRSG